MTKRQEMYKKYNETLKAMYEKNGQDNGVCLDKLIYTYRVKKGIIEGTDVYDEIPADFDFDKFESDYNYLMED